MTRTHDIQTLSDDELLRSLSALLSQSRRVEADLVAHIGEVDDRRLFAREACSSMFVYCIEVLHLSEPEAYLRIAVARAARKHPMLLVMLGEGRLHLSGIAILAPHLTEANREMVLARAAHKSKRQIEELAAELAPKPDAPSTIRKLPALLPAPADQLRPDGVESSTTQEHVPPVEAVKPEPPPPPTPPVSARPEPLSPERYKVQFTASRELRDKLERLQALMNGDMAAVIEAAVTEKLERIEAKRYGGTKNSRKTVEDSDTSPKSRYIPAAAKRIVRRRDSGQCRFVGKNGTRCTERRRLEFHHHDPFGRGGDHDPDNIRLMCRQHNAYLAEREYGKDVMNQFRRRDNRVSEAAPVYGLQWHTPSGVAMNDSA